MCLFGCSKGGSDKKETTSQSAVSHDSALFEAKEITAEKELPNSKELKTYSVKGNAEKGKKLKKAIEKAASGENISITGELDKGLFEYKNPRSQKEMYSEERSESGEKKAKKNADKFVEAVSKYLGKLEFSRVEYTDVGTGENGADSVLYTFYYVPSPSKEVEQYTLSEQLVVKTDSTGVIIYASSSCTIGEITGEASITLPKDIIEKFEKEISGFSVKGSEVVITDYKIEYSALQSGEIAPKLILFYTVNGGSTLQYEINLE